MGATRGFNAGGGIFAYYNYTYANEFNAYFGIFPRSAWIAKYPRSFFREDYLFLHPEINGAMLQYSGESGVIKGYAEATLEHFGADLKNATDEFYALFGGEIEIWDLLFLGANGALYHHQDDRILSKDNQNTYLMDRVLYGAHLGLDLRGFKAVGEIFDSAELKVALLGQSERKRQSDKGFVPFYNGIGGEVSAKLQYKGFGVEDIYYFGSGQMKYFGEYCEKVYDRFPLYQGAFNTINIFYEYKSEFLGVEVGFRFYNIGKNLSKFAHQQYMNLHFDLRKLLKARQIN